MNHDKPFIIGITDMAFRDTCWQEGQLIYISLNGVNDARDLINQGLQSDNQSLFFVDCLPLHYSYHGRRGH